MSMLSKDDRINANALHGLKERGTMSLNHRDASRSNLWKGQPTLINTPRNPPRDSGVRRNDPSPWSTLGNKPGNPTARKTLINGPPPRKKAKATHAPASPGSSQWVLGKGTSMIPKTPRRGPEIIDIEDNDEDMGTLMSTPDPLNIIDEPPSVQVLKKRRHSPPSFRVPIDVDADGDDDIIDAAASGSGSRVVRDGAPTVALQKSIGHLPDDPITEFPPSPSLSRKKSYVKAMVQKIENKPHLDLRNFVKGEPRTRKKSVKGNMKGKNTAPDEPQDPIATKPTTFTSSEVVDRHPGVNKKQLRIKEWFRGTEHLGDGYFVTWEGDEKLLITQEGKTDPSLFLRLKGEVHSVEYSEPDSDVSIMSLSTFKPTTGRFKSRDTARFKMGDKFSGKVIIKFDDGHEDWSTHLYEALIAWVKKIVNSRKTLRAIAAGALWETSRRQSVLGDTSARRQQHQQEGEAKSDNDLRRILKRPAPRDDGEDEELPPVAELCREVTNSRDTSSTSSSRTTGTFEVHLFLFKFPDGQLVVHRHEGRALLPSIQMRCAVNINNADLKRLQPGEFLNDTLIEFGLKFWLRQLEESNPELASQVHVFSSFFYKKLNKKNMDEGYESVRKWTAKINLFSKKYIIVPINENLHWYLAIIYHPEYILTAPPISASPATRGRKSVISAPLPVSERRSLVSMRPLSTTSNPPSKPPSTTDQRLSREKPPSAKSTSSPKPHSHSAGPLIEQSSVFPEEMENAISSSSLDEAEVEAEMTQGMDLLSFNPGVCATITSLDSASPSRATSVMDQDTPHSNQTEDTIVPESLLSDLSMDVEEDSQPQKRSPSVSDFDKSVVHSRPEIHDVDMDDLPSASSSRLDVHSQFDDEKDAKHHSTPTSVAPTNFYGKSQKAQGKQKAIPNQAVLHKDDYPVYIDEAEPEEDPIVFSTASETTTYIFTFDSLGSRHPQAIKQLSRYLKKEAEDKMKRMDTSDPVGKQALVPVQPNYSDCGLYLLHFAKTFISDPLKYCQIIKARPKGTMNVDRQDDWKAELTGNMRERLAHEIKQLSVEWRHERAAKEEAKRKEAAEGTGPIEVVESSDDEVDIVETIPAVKTTSTGKKGAKGKAPVRGNAMRVR
ncbi:hypothetical protein DXG03_003295 [Asterophora parasitica]|uniref:Ubiquitin-like protease family profile domain-containing protein n=1 Tax=Asterophora parasitica TaxID=117018 RepID=A0A9P7KDG3_9AGAR|nr:hypothetical protein DXG03_003295 [Asterophora parasitica]